MPFESLIHTDGGPASTELSIFPPLWSAHLLRCFAVCSHLACLFHFNGQPSPARRGRRKKEARCRTVVINQTVCTGKNGVCVPEGCLKYCCLFFCIQSATKAHKEMSLVTIDVFVFPPLSLHPFTLSLTTTPLPLLSVSLPLCCRREGNEMWCTVTRIRSHDFLSSPSSLGWLTSFLVVCFARLVWLWCCWRSLLPSPRSVQMGHTPGQGPGQGPRADGDLCLCSFSAVLLCVCICLRVVVFVFCAEVLCVCLMLHFVFVFLLLF